MPAIVLHTGSFWQQAHLKRISIYFLTLCNCVIDDYSKPMKGWFRFFFLSARHRLCLRRRKRSKTNQMKSVFHTSIVYKDHGVWSSPTRLSLDISVQDRFKQFLKAVEWIVRHGWINTEIYSSFFLRLVYRSQRVFRTVESRGRSREHFGLCLQQISDLNLILFPNLFDHIIIIDNIWGLFFKAAPSMKFKSPFISSPHMPCIVHIIILILKSQQISKSSHTKYLTNTWLTN